MQIEKSAGYVTFRLTDEMTLPQWPEFIEEVKKIVPVGTREYDPQTHEWRVPEFWWPEIDRVHKQLFSDPNQLELL